jgi:hypothetical protein
MIFHTQAGCHRCVKAEVVYASKPGALTPESPTMIFLVIENCLIPVLELKNSYGAAHHL